MKRLIALLLIVFVSLTVLLSADPAVVDPVSPSSNSAYSKLLLPVAPVNTRMMGMGGAGLALAKAGDSFFVNPAALASRDFSLTVGSPVITFYNPVELLESDITDAIEDDDKDAIVDAATDFLNSLGQYNKVAAVDASLSFTAAGFGFGIFVDDVIHTSGNGLSANVINQAVINIAMGYGHSFELPLDFSIDIGAMIHFSYMAYNKSIGAGRIIDELKKDNPDFLNLLTGTPMMAGFAFPIDLGVNVGMPLGFDFSVVARNLNGKYYMTAFEDIDDMGSSPFGGGSRKDFSFTTDWSLDAGLGWHVDTWYLSPGIAVDFVDIVGFAEDEATWKGLLDHLKIGAELRVLSFLELRGGLNQGYWTLGASVDLYAVRMDVSYFWQNYGTVPGGHGIDGFSVRFNIGFDR